MKTLLSKLKQEIESCNYRGLNDKQTSDALKTLNEIENHITGLKKSI